jgi:GT2 family glycosyltransferase
VSDCLSSIRRQKYPPELVKVIVIDNYSSDSTVAYIKEQYPEVKVIVNRRNIGFAAANNQGYFLAQKQRADYLVLLNQDTIVEPNWLDRLVRIAERSPKIGAVQPKLLLHPETHLINSFGNSIHLLGFAFCNHYRELSTRQTTDEFELPYGSGAALLLKMSALKKTGLFDPRLFMYHEDVDLGWRLRLAGYKIIFDPLAVVYHKYSYSKAVYKMYYMDRNRWIVLLQNYRLATLLVISPMLLVMEIGIILFAIKNGWIKQKLQGYGWIVMHLPQILSRRLDVQFRLRKVRDREILKLFVGSIKFQQLDNPLLRLVNPITELYLRLTRLLVRW